MEIKNLSGGLSLNPNNEDFLAMQTQNDNTPPSYDDVFQYAKDLNYGELHFKIDKKTGLFAVVAIHSTKLGPAIGGCRCIPYASTQAAITDAVRLAYGMSYKAAICELPHGGAKAVLMRPPVIANRQAYFQSFAEFVNELNGRYVTAMDSGTDVNDMDIIATKTRYVTCTSEGGGGDPSPFTALGVKRGIEAAVKFKLGQDNLRDVHVAIQGAGHVGYYLARDLVEAGARVTMADINTANLERCKNEFKIEIVSPESIYEINCDVFAPCALGAGLNATTIPRLNTTIVAGAANNQLKDIDEDDKLLFERGILYAPDFLINSGGLIYAASVYDHGNFEQAKNHILNIYDALIKIFTRAKAEHKPTNHIAQVIADERLY
ncbi:MAG: amino acid dehydrogenase [Gammaproteobacteria bacterium]|nr:amino acid dehydrogenase [Gammaproteobacteria bacterium]